MTVQPLSFARVHLTTLEHGYELVGGPQGAMEILTASIHGREGVTMEIITKDEAYMELYLSKVGAGCFLQHEFDIIANEGRRAKASSILMGLTRRLGIGVLYEPVGFVIDRP